MFCNLRLLLSRREVDFDLDEQLIKKGTTTVGIVVKEGIVLAADKRASMGYLIAEKEADKIHLIDDRTAMTWAGSVADSQMILRFLKSQLQLYKLKRNKPASTKATTTLLSHYIFSNAHSFSPFLVQFIVGGKDNTGFHLYSLDPSGSNMEAKKFTSTGSGSPMAYGVLEDNYNMNMSLDQAVKLSVRSVNAAISRDLATGDGIDVVKITKDGIKRLTKQEIEKLIKK